MPNTDIGDIAQLLTDAARDIQAARGTQATLDEVCQRAMQVVSGCTSAGINEMQRNQGGKTLAATDERSTVLHDIQYEVGDGPCLQAIWEERVVWTDDLEKDERWPRFAAEATKLGIRSSVAIQLYTHGDTLGALNLFSDVPGNFDEATRDVAQIFGAHAIVAIAGAREHAQLAEALTTRLRIGQATGILAERHDLTTDEAFTLLARTSQDHNIKIRDLAARLVASEDEERTRKREQPPG